MLRGGPHVYEVKLSRRALRDADHLPEHAWQRILEVLRALRENPRPFGSLKIVGEERLYRLRVGDYRALYDVDDSAQTVLVLRIQHRREAYRNL